MQGSNPGPEQHVSTLNRSVGRVRETIQLNVVGEYRHFQQSLGRCATVNGQVLEEYGYRSHQRRRAVKAAGRGTINGTVRSKECVLRTNRMLAKNPR